MPKQVKYALGIDLGGTNIKLGIVSDSGKILKKTSIKTEATEGPSRVIKNIETGIINILKGNKKKLLGIGIGSPGVVSIGKGIVENPPNIPGWNKVKLRDRIQKRFNYAVHLENDANAAAIGELIFGAGKKYDSFVMITLGTGVGGGIVMDNKIYRGQFGAAGEIGHISIDFNGPQCNCGSTGCIEAYVGNHYLKKRVRKELKKHPESRLWNLIDDDLTKVSPRLIQKAAELGDPYAKSVILNMGIQLGTAFSSLSNVLDISTYIIGGGVAGFGKPLFDTIKKTTEARVLTSLSKRVKIRPAQLKNEAGIKGASALVFYNM